MKFWQKIVASVTLTIGLAYAAPGFAAQAAKSGATLAASKDLVLKGDAKCTTCHDESDAPQLLAIGKTHHGTRADGRTPSCTSCHGDSDPHANHKGSDKPPKPDVTFSKSSKNSTEQRSDTCLTCHKNDAKRSHWEGSKHQTRGVACTSCHIVHAGQDKVRDKKTQPEVCFACHQEQRTQVNKPSHHPVLEGKVACSDCHNVHGTAGEKLLVRDTVNDTCYTCHMEKRGPFVHNHEPVSDNCMNCHNPHGTTAESLLKVRPPFLCHQCHTPHGGFIPQLAGSQVTLPAANGAGRSGANVTQGRACANCHTQVHGSNNPTVTAPTPQYMFR
jgi:DmsE family decaheme c-type cytochrome